MKLRDRINLIPRNNWDFGLFELIKSIPVHKNINGKVTNLEKLFQTKPIWTKSGRVSLYAILKALDLPKNSNVGVPLFCCSVVFDAIIQAGLKPKFIDVNLSDANLSVEDLIKKISDLSAIIAVHMFGNPCDIDSINVIAGSRPVIEDCAQSLFSTYKGKQTGLLSTASFFSFRCGKYISAGEGSAIICRDKTLFNKIEEIVSSFRKSTNLDFQLDAFTTFLKASLYKRPLYGLVGYPIGMRLDKAFNLTAKEGFKTEQIYPSHLALVESRILSFFKNINQQTEHAQKLLNELTPIHYSLPVLERNRTSNWYQFALKFKNEELRNSMADNLFTRGIDTAKYLNNITEEAQKKYGYSGDCPNSEFLSKTILLIPIYYKLSNKDIEYVSRCINEFSKKVEIKEEKLDL